MSRKKKTEAAAPVKTAALKCVVTGKDLVNPVTSVHIKIDDSTFLACVAYFKTTSGGYTAVPVGAEAEAMIRKALAGLERK